MGERNKEKRKDEPLTSSEWLTFFLLPFRKKGDWDFENTDRFNEIEEERFEKFGFQRKQKESSLARAYGFISYLMITIIIISLIFL
ncbi:hypothetical protein [Lacinutrix jangbogonensis]|uniref:hypothetical protein n=1 Tax=Lacinutrix jangbogonensis TaxID=1469557 RepID=UPI001F14A2C0|nr:hypothetical protein [Lacinutrix jangbogonensis]